MAAIKYGTSKKYGQPRAKPTSRRDKYGEAAVADSGVTTPTMTAKTKGTVTYTKK